jgi:methionyl-tRNA formyltransferase
MRGFAPWPGAYTTFREQTCQLWGSPAAPSTEWTQFATGEIIHTTTDLYVVCGEGTCLRLEAVQIEGRKKISARQFANGARLAADDGFD